MASSINASTAGAGGVITTADNTGILNLQTAGTTAVTIDTSQNVGIGTASPSTKLTVQGSGNVYTSNIVTDTGNSGYYIANSQRGYYLLSAGNAFSIYDNTSAAERMRIDSSGNVLIGQTSNTQGGRLVITGSAGTADDLVINTNASYAELQSFNSKPLVLNRQGNNLYFGTSTSSVAGGAITFFNPQAINTYINVGHKTGSTNGASFYVASYNGVQIGDIAQSGTTAVVYNTTSDYRLKEDVKPIANALDRVSKLNPVTYKWKNADNEFGEGYLAHELAEVCPLAVTGEKDAVNEDGSIKPQNVDYSKVVALLSASIKELKAIVDAQQQEINALKGVV